MIQKIAPEKKTNKRNKKHKNFCLKMYFWWLWYYLSKIISQSSPKDNIFFSQATQEFIEQMLLNKNAEYSWENQREDTEKNIQNLQKTYTDKSMLGKLWPAPIRLLQVISHYRFTVCCKAQCQRRLVIYPGPQTHIKFCNLVSKSRWWGKDI